MQIAQMTEQQSGHPDDHMGDHAMTCSGANPAKAGMM